MKKLLSATALVLALTFTGTALAHSSDAADSYMEKAIAKLPPQKAQEFREAMNDAHEQNRDLYEQIHQLHVQLHDILVADKFDAEAFTAKSAELRELHEKMGTNLDKSFASSAAGLTPNERAMLAKAMDSKDAAEHAEHVSAKKAQ